VIAIAVALLEPEILRLRAAHISIRETSDAEGAPA
jgi:hypothetical protein